MIISAGAAASSAARAFRGRSLSFLVFQLKNIYSFGVTEEVFDALLEKCRLPAFFAAATDVAASPNLL